MGITEYLLNTLSSAKQTNIATLSTPPPPLLPRPHPKISFLRSSTQKHQQRTQFNFHTYLPRRLLFSSSLTLIPLFVPSLGGKVPQSAQAELFRSRTSVTSPHLSFFADNFAFRLNTQNTVCLYAKKQKQNSVQSAQRHAKNRAAVSADSASSQDRLRAIVIIYYV